MLGVLDLKHDVFLGGAVAAPAGINFLYQVGVQSYVQLPGEEIDTSIELDDWKPFQNGFWLLPIIRGYGTLYYKPRGG
jgi:hypothetical protein